MQVESVADKKETNTRKKPRRGSKHADAAPKSMIDDDKPIEETTEAPIADDDDLVDVIVATDEEYVKAEKEKQLKRKKKWLSPGVRLQGPARVESSTGESDMATKIREMADKHGLLIGGTRDRITAKTDKDSVMGANTDRDFHNLLKLYVFIVIV